MIDRTPKYWTGDQPDDIAEWLREYTENPELEVKPVVCRCCGRDDAFSLRVDAEEGAMQVTCTACKTKKRLLDSDEIWADCSPRSVRCRVCKERTNNVQVGFERREDGDVKWVYIGNRCTNCGTLGSYADWSIDYGPTDEMEKNI